MSEIPELEIKDTRENPLRTVASVISKSLSTVVTLVSEIAVIAVIGSMVGTYYFTNTVVNDCKQVQLAKIGSVYIKCMPVEPVKDTAVQPPR